MRIVQQQATLLAITPDAESLIERCGRVCYKSEDAITLDSSAAFIRRLVKNGHHSVLEHASASILFICDRGVSHELVRHRIASYSQESTRYCNYSREQHCGQLTVIHPPGLNGFDRYWMAICAEIEETYLAMITRKISPQIARSILPNCLKTEVVATANLREWRHILSLRTSKAAHPQMREIMCKAAALLAEKCPNVFAEYTGDDDEES